LASDYEEQFHRANLTFLHQRVYDPQSKQMVSLTTISDDVLAAIESQEELDFLGPLLDAETAQRIAEAQINPSTRQPYANATGSTPYDASEWRNSNQTTPTTPKTPTQTVSAQSRRTMSNPTLRRRDSSTAVQSNTIKQYFSMCHTDTHTPHTHTQHTHTPHTQHTKHKTQSTSIV
jgi:exonuclease 1